MDIPDIDKDLVIMETEKKGMIFNLQSTLDHPEFIRYFRNREKLPHTPFKNWTGTFGPDLTKHFEIAYQTLLAWMIQSMKFMRTISILLTKTFRMRNYNIIVVWNMN